MDFKRSSDLPGVVAMEILSGTSLRGVRTEGRFIGYACQSAALVNLRVVLTTNVLLTLRRSQGSSAFTVKSSFRKIQIKVNWMNNSGRHLLHFPRTCVCVFHWWMFPHFSEEDVLTLWFRPQCVNTGKNRCPLDAGKILSLFRIHKSVMIGLSFCFYFGGPWGISSHRTFV